MALLDIYNAALDALGVARITTLGGDGTEQDNFMNANGERLIKAVMCEHPWPELVARKELNRTPGTLTLSAKTVGTGRTATAGATFFLANDVRVTNAGAKLYEIDHDGVAEITAYTSGTVVTVEITTAFTHGLAGDAIPQNGWYLDPIGTAFAYCYAKPSDYLRLGDLDDAKSCWAFEGPRILTDYDDAVLRYIAYDATETNWGTLLTEAIIARLAAEAARPLTKKSVAERAELWQAYADKLASGKGKARSEVQRTPRYARSDLADVR